jgi:uncharacterized protein with von Willebrand factor type A (vWA) domain
LDDIDLDALLRHLGDEASADARTLAEIEKQLRETGLIKRSADGSLRLSPKAMRQLGKSLLRDVADRMSGRQGARELRQAGRPVSRAAPAAPGRSVTPRVGMSPAR